MRSPPYMQVGEGRARSPSCRRRWARRTGARPSGVLSGLRGPRARSELLRHDADDAVGWPLIAPVEPVLHLEERSSRRRCTILPTGMPVHAATTRRDRGLVDVRRGSGGSSPWLALSASRALGHVAARGVAALVRLGLSHLLAGVDRRAACRPSPSRSRRAHRLELVLRLGELVLAAPRAALDRRWTPLFRSRSSALELGLGVQR